LERRKFINLGNYEKRGKGERGKGKGKDLLL
jgi:hypothetical protein